jgi:hypothetical protein
MSSGDAPRVAEPPVPAVCRWTIRLILLPFFLLLMAGFVLETVGGQPGFMARPTTLLAFGVLVLGLGVSMLGWYKTWAEAGWRRQRWRRAGRRETEPLPPGWHAPRWRRVSLAFSGLFWTANGILLLVGGFIQL